MTITPKTYTLRPYSLTVLKIMDTTPEGEPWEMHGLFNFKLTQDQAKELIKKMMAQSKKQAGFVEFRLLARMK